MKKYLILAMIIMLGVCVNAQQLPVASYYMYNYTRTNPGSLGSKDMLCANIIHKDAFTGLPGWPQTTVINLEIPFKLFGGKHGAGISIYRDAWGFYEDIDIKLGYAFRFDVADGTLGVGLNGGVMQKSLDGKWVGTQAMTDPSQDQNIPPEKVDGEFAVSFSAGMFYRSEDIYLGASVLNAYAQEFDYSESGSGSNTSTATEVLRPHYYVTAGYNLQMSNSAYELKPSINLYSDGATVTFDLNGTLEYNKKIWGGVSYRAGSAVTGMVGLMIFDGARIGYAYDFHTSAITNYAKGSHEILFNYCVKLGIDKAPQRYKSIRYL